MFILALLFEMVYVLSPQFIKTKIENLDYDKDKGHKLSYTGVISILLIISIILN